MEDVVNHQTLARPWIHSREEDTDTDIVYRPTSYAFPPARGREGYTLHPDGTLTRRSPGAADRTQTTPIGTWEVGVADEGSAQLAFHVHDQPSQKFAIVSLTPDRLVVRRT